MNNFSEHVVIKLEEMCREIDTILCQSESMTTDLKKKYEARSLTYFALVILGQSPGNNCYQYQLQSMWQKCWSQNAAMAHGIRYRERGPLKSWRPETMADAIWAVLQEGLSLSQAARKNDIPYPTFVLYANRVHNMLGPSLTDTSPALGGTLIFKY